jgi:mevalonate kinase
MINSTASACGKIILSGEYAVVFGYPGIAVPSPLRVNMTFEENDRGSEIIWNGITGNDHWNTYIRKICELVGAPKGSLTIENDLPLGKGMGASTAMVVALARVFGLDRAQALAIEHQMNPGHSGIDFAVIWEEKSLLYKKGEEPEPIHLSFDLQNTTLIDTGAPNETTTELVAWVKERKEELVDALETIGTCTERIIRGEDLKRVMRDHHRAQVALGVVPKEVQSLIEEIEKKGGAAKVIGAGGRTGGGGMVLTYRAA